MNTILITGATGFLGEYVVRDLLGSGLEIRAFVRPTSNTMWLRKKGVHLLSGDLNQQTTIETALQGVDLLINLASLGFGHAQNIVAASVKAGVTRTVFVSSTSIFSKLQTSSKSKRVQAELIIAESGLDYTIIRPTMIYGSPRDRNIWRLINYINKWPAIPIIGSGEVLQQPVFVSDVARAIVSAMQCDCSVRRSYDIAGAEPISFLEMINIISTSLGRNVKKFHVPLIMAQYAAFLFGNIGLRITSEQVLRFEEAKNFDISAAVKDLGYSPLDFEHGLALELQWLGK